MLISAGTIAESLTQRTIPSATRWKPDRATGLQCRGVNVGLGTWFP